MTSEPRCTHACGPHCAARLDALAARLTAQERCNARLRPVAAQLLGQPADAGQAGA